MKNRRDFLIQGTLAACALTYLKPLTSKEKYFSSLASLNTISEGNKLTILHGENSNIELYETKKINQHVIKLTGINANNSDEGIYEHKGFVHTMPFPIEIEKKGNINVGIIHLSKIQFNHNNALHILDVNETALFLKEKASCHFIICNFHEQQPNKQSNIFSEEKTFANSSSDIDLIVCKKEIFTNYTTFVAHNKHGKEVIINATFGTNNVVGKIDILFNNKLQKINIAV